MNYYRGLIGPCRPLVAMKLRTIQRCRPYFAHCIKFACFGERSLCHVILKTCGISPQRFPFFAQFWITLQRRALQITVEWGKKIVFCLWRTRDADKDLWSIFDFPHMAELVSAMHAAASCFCRFQAGQRHRKMLFTSKLDCDLPFVQVHPSILIWHNH